MRQNVIPGARIVTIVTRKFRAVATDDAPANCTPRLKNACPSGALRAASLVAVPGCYPTAVQLGLIPLLEAGVIDPAFLLASEMLDRAGAERLGIFAVTPIGLALVLEGRP